MDPDFQLKGLIAAAYTPMREDGGLWLAQIGPMVNHLEAMAKRGVY